MAEDPPTANNLTNGIKAKNVSFNPETTIVEQVNKSDPEATLPYKRGSMDNWQISKGTTKTADGELSLCKSLLKAQNESESSLLSSATSFTDWSTVTSLTDTDVWEYSRDRWNKFLEEKQEATNGRVIQSDTPWFDDPVEWSNEAKKKPDFDLTQPTLGFVLVKRLQLGEGVMPQSVARDPTTDTTYVSDLQKNAIHYFKGWDYKGLWCPGQTFLIPRYVLCIPDLKHGNRRGMNVVVLDQVALHVYKASGELKRKTFEGEALQFRGLAFHQEHQRLITTQKIEGKGTYLVFIETRTFSQIVSKIFLEPTATTDYYINTTKCRFLTCNDGHVITTDMGLGCYYVTSIKAGTTEAHSHTVKSATGGSTNLLKDATGVFVDPAGNVIIATCSGKEDDEPKGSFEVFTANGIYVKSIKGIKTQRPVGVLVEGKTLYVVDIRRRAVELYNLSEYSPRILQ